MKRRSLKDDEFFNLGALLTWLGLTFQAGAINAAGLLMCFGFVSHITGIGSRIGIAFGQGQYLTSLKLIGTPVFFMFGCAVSSWLIDCRIAKGQVPFFKLVMGSIALLLGIINFEQINEHFEILGPVNLIPNNFVLMFLLTFICGMMNASVASTTHGLIRPTHLTGLSTDIGINIPKILFLKKFKAKKKIRQLFAIRLLIFFFFSTGSFISSYIVIHHLPFAFLMPSLTSILFFFIALKTFDAGDWDRYGVNQGQYDYNQQILQAKK